MSQLDKLPGFKVGCFVDGFNCDYLSKQYFDAEYSEPYQTIVDGDAGLSNQVIHNCDLNGIGSALDTVYFKLLYALRLAYSTIKIERAVALLS